MSGAKHLAHAILKHLQQEAAQNPQEDKVESLEGKCLRLFQTTCILKINKKNNNKFMLM